MHHHNLIKELPVKCPACGGYYPRIDRAHAIAHGFKSLAAFRAEHKVDYSTLGQRSRNKIKSLYNIDYTRWAVVYFTASNEARYVTKQYFRDYDAAKAAGTRSASKFPLGDGAFGRHFDGRNPLAIMANGTHARYFGFDIDTKDEALQHALKLIATLEAEGIPRHDIHVSHSGSKGYHVELFTKKHVMFGQWVTFGEYIVDRAGLTGQAIEFRPERNNGRGWKLPLTYHHKTGNFAGYVDKDTFDVMSEFESHEYLFAIEPMPLSRVMPIIKRAEADKAAVQARIKAEKERQAAEARAKRQAVRIVDDRVFQTKEEKAASAVRYLREGLVEKKTRWKVTRTLALYLYHEQGLTIDEIKPVLMDWTAKQIEAGMAETPLDQCEKEIDDLMEWLPRSWGFGATIREINVTRQEIDWILGIQNRSARSILWALLLRSKAYADNRDGTFFTSDSDLLKMLHGMSKTTVSRWRRWLAKKGFIEVWIDKHAYVRKKATVYRLRHEIVGQPEVIETIELDETMDCRDLLTHIASKLFSVEQLKKLKLN